MGKMERGVSRKRTDEDKTREDRIGGEGGRHEGEQQKKEE